MNKFKILSPLVCVCGLSWITPALGHEFWLEPSDFRPQTGQEITVGLSLGDTFYQGIHAKRNNEDIIRFVARGSGESVQVAGEAGDSPIGRVALSAPGVHIVEFSDRNHFTELEASIFERYLARKGLDSAIATRKERGESDKPGREAFSHSLKTILVVDDHGQEVRDQTLGLKLEVVSESRLDAGRDQGPFSFEILYEGSPLIGVLVTATRRGAPAERVSMRSDENGRVAFDLPQADVWMIDTVYMVPAPPEIAAVWQSYWASLTFELPSRK